MNTEVKRENSILSFFKRNYGYFAAGLIVLAVFFIAEAIFGIFPFGKTIMASYDQLAQVCPIIEHYFRVLSGESGLFHTFYLGGGMDMFGILAYCTVSPFTLLFLIGGQGNAVYMVSIVLPLKCVCVSVSMLWFLRKRFPVIPQYVLAGLALLYTFSGYLYVANTYIIWVDLMIYCPLVLAGFISLTEKGSVKLLAVSLTAMLYACFSITCFSFFTVFPLFLIYIMIVLPKEERREKTAKLCIAFILAVAAALPILSAALKASRVSARGTGLFTRVFEILSESDVKKGKLFEHLYEKFTYIFCDAALVILTFVYFIRSKAKDKRAVFMFVALTLLLLPCIIDESMLLLNMGSYYSYALRFGFLSGTYLTYAAALGTEQLITDGKWGKINDENGAKSYIGATVAAALTVGATFFAVSLFTFISDKKYENFEIIKRIKELLSTEELPFKNFFACFAHSEGGLEAVLLLFLVAVIFFAAAAAICKLKILKPAQLAPFILIVALSQSVFYGFSLVKGDRQGGSGEKLGYFTKIGDELAATDDGLYRVKNFDYYVSSDSPLITGLYSHTLFSSIADKKNLTIPVTYGYRGNSTNSTKSNGGGMFSDSLVGYKYVVYKRSDESSAQSRSYLKATDISVNDYIVYENQVSLPMAAVIDGNEDIFDDANLYAHLDGLLKGLAGNGATLLETRIYGENGDLSVSFDAPKKSDTFFVTFFPEDMNVTGDTGVKTYGYSESVRYFTANLKADGLTEEDIKTYCRAFAIRQDELKTITAKAKDRAADVKLRRNGFEIPTVTAEKGQYFYMSFANLDGYEIKVNGKRVNLRDNLSDLMFFPLEDGENVITVKYKSPYKAIILVSAVAGAAVIVAVWFIYRKKPRLFKACENALTIAAYILVAALLAFFFVFPTGYGLYKFFFKYLKYLV